MSDHWAEELSSREQRERQLQAMSPLHRAGLILDYEIFLQEDSDAIEVILNHEFGSESSPTVSLHVPVSSTSQKVQAEHAGPF